MISSQRLMPHFHRYTPMIRSWQFWCAQGSILLIAVVHNILEAMGMRDLGMLYFIPISFYWVPVILMSYVYGIRGAAATSSWVILISIPNWLIWHTGPGRIGEMSLIMIVAVTAFFIGRLVDQKAAAQRRAKEYAAYSVLNQEEVLRRLSIDIHDGSMQDLIAVCHRLDTLPDGSRLAEARNVIEGVVQQLRNISKGMHPSILDDLGSVAAIRRQLIDLAARTSIEQEFEVRGEDRRLPPDIELQMFRIAQEALRNIERHAKAKKVTVSIWFDAREVRLIVADDGVGFDRTAFGEGPGKEGHFGLIGMRERAELVGGKLDVKSAVGAGTRISATFPAVGSGDNQATERSMALTG